MQNEICQFYTTNKSFYFPHFTIFVVKHLFFVFNTNIHIHAHLNAKHHDNYKWLHSKTWTEHAALQNCSSSSDYPIIKNCFDKNSRIFCLLFVFPSWRDPQSNNKQHFILSMIMLLLALTGLFPLCFTIRFCLSEALCTESIFNLVFLRALLLH